MSYCGDVQTMNATNETKMKATTNSMQANIKSLLGSSYDWDAETNELQYLGNPVAFWITDYEAEMVAKAAAMCR